MRTVHIQSEWRRVWQQERMPERNLAEDEVLSMRRAIAERLRTVRVWKAHLRHLHATGPILCPCEFEIGRFRKAQRIGGCGNSRCFLCHGDKLLGRPTLQELRARHVEREWLREISGGLRRPSPRLPATTGGSWFDTAPRQLSRR